MSICASVIYHTCIFFSAIVHCRVFINLALQRQIHSKPYFPCGHRDKGPILTGLPKLFYNMSSMVRTVRKLIDKKRKD